MHHHDHHHGHACHHHTPPTDLGRAFLVGIALNSAFIACEVIYGLKANSMALLADAGHNASDVLSLILAWGAVLLGRRKPSARFTYGLGGSSIIASLTNAVLLLVVVGGLGWEALTRLMHPEETAGVTVMVVAAIGVVINGVTALMFMRGSKSDINIRGAYLHMAADAAISLGVVITGAIIMQTGWLWLDPLATLAISAVIIIGTWGLLKESVNLALHAVPQDINTDDVKSYLSSRAGVKEVHDLHIWAMSTKEVASSVHLVMEGGHPGDAFINEIAHGLEHKFNIKHTTVQIELGDSGHDCPLAPDHVI